METKELHYSSGPELTAATAGKTIESIELPDDGMDDWLIFKFKDGSELHIRYSWLYEWEMRQPE